MQDEETLKRLTYRALNRNRRSIDLVTSFLQEASVLVLVFGILDTYATDKLNLRIGEVVAALGIGLFVAAFAFRWICFRILRMLIGWSLAIQTQAGGGE